MNITVITSSDGDEASSSLASAENVGKLLSNLGVNVTTVDVGGAGLDSLRFLKSDIFFPVMHGFPGESGKIQDELARNGHRYIGSSARVSAQCLDKSLAKDVCRAQGIRVFPEFVCRPRDQDALVTAFRASGQREAVVKPVSSGSSIGVNFCRTVEDIVQAADGLFNFDWLMMEPFGFGVEVSVAVTVIGGTETALPPIVRPVHPKLPFDVQILSERESAAKRLPFFEKDIQNEALRVHKALECRHFSKIDFMLHDSGDLTFIEIDSIPGFSKDSYFFRSLKRKNLDPIDWMRMLINNF
ncbi:D-alanine--D-alanine ligase family protein [Paraburkholderia tropica]|uniref:D-alanine--D-alanine ligase family protein n=1 Tax=Paraburkholderia tropica TaxID=92647 RepID=UPI002AB63970|nr:hypothetical protein [Paraburkholderia tropica]